MINLTKYTYELFNYVKKGLITWRGIIHSDVLEMSLPQNKIKIH